MSRLGMTAAQVRQLMARQDGLKHRLICSADGVPVPKGRRALGDLNKVEREFLETQLLPDPTVLDIWPHGIRLVLGDNDRYEPDFLVMRSDGTLEIFEVKAQWSNGQCGMADSREKVKCSATIFPFPITIASKQSRKNGGGWKLERFDPTRRHIENRTPPPAEPPHTPTQATPDTRRKARMRVVPEPIATKTPPVVQ